MRKKRNKINKDSINIKGFFRLNIINSDGSVAGDTGWKGNQVTNLGFRYYLADNIGKSNTSLQIQYVALGTGTAPGAAATTLDGEIMASTQRKSVTYSNVASTTAQFVATFASSDSFVTTSYNISNIGLFNTNATNNTLFAGNTYASSSLNTNQNVGKLAFPIGNNGAKNDVYAGNSLELQLLIDELEKFVNSENVEDWTISREALVV